MANLQFNNENGADLACTHIIYAGLYWNAHLPNIASDTWTETKDGRTVTLNKRKMQFKHASDTMYHTVEADMGNIYFSDAYIVGYVEVTDYVQQYGIGDYYAANVPGKQGNNNNASGGWGLIVIYENEKMKWRTISAQDGAIHINTNGGALYFSINNIQTTQTGQVNAKMGLMVSDGDVLCDYFHLLNTNNTWTPLSHASNSVTDFFNSSIETGGNPRNPNQQNNYAVDVVMFDVPNPSNTNIANNQTSLEFKAGTTSDGYTIHTFVLSVDAYIPDLVLDNRVSKVGGHVVVSQDSLTALPEQEIEYTLEIRNTGNETVINPVVEIPVPYNMDYYGSSAAYFLTTGVQPEYIDNTKMLRWTLDSIPAANPGDIVARLTYTLAATGDCHKLLQMHCDDSENVTASGSFSGEGAISGQSISNLGFVYDYHSEGGLCDATPVTIPTSITIVDMEDYLSANCINPDFRVRACPAAGGEINLSKYLDTIVSPNITWSPSPAIDPLTGIIDAGKLVAPGTYTYTYTYTYRVTNPCVGGMTGKIYLKMLGGNSLKQPQDTVTVCYETAEAVNINQIFGIDAGGTWTYVAPDGTPVFLAPYVKESAACGGAVIMNGKGIYENSSIGFYGTTDTKRVVFTYTPAATSCLGGKKYTIVIILYKL
ncbi:MAG: hypothetical protein LBQ70_01850 [Prevotellaceae bacterium]|nr:hypothetical protein [Prevotellaceae bacterium]